MKSYRNLTSLPMMVGYMPKEDHVMHMDTDGVVKGAWADLLVGVLTRLNFK